MSEVRGTNCDRKSLEELIMAVSGWTAQRI